jgi:hypothetical protein
MCPGLPRESNRYCDRVGRVMNYGDGLYGGMFVCGMYAAAFFESNPRTSSKPASPAFPRQRLREAHPRPARLAGAVTQ